MATVSIFIAFLAGIISFLSPCVLPLIPGYLAYLSGVSLQNAQHQRWKVFFNSVFFVLGFAVIFSLLGVILNTILLNVSYQIQTWLARIGGLVIIVFGLHLLGLLKIGFLDREKKLKVGKFSTTYLTSFAFGTAFAVGWTPCIGAILGAVLSLVVANPGMGFILLLAYSLGLGIPFLIVGLFSDCASRYIAQFQRFFKYFNIIVGILLVVLGTLVFTQTLNLIANFGLLNKILLR